MPGGTVPKSFVFIPQIHEVTRAEENIWNLDTCLTNHILCSVETGSSSSGLPAGARCDTACTVLSLSQLCSAATFNQFDHLLV